MLNWSIGIGQIIGMSASQAFYAVHGSRMATQMAGGKGFKLRVTSNWNAPRNSSSMGKKLAAGQLCLGAAYAYRAAIQYTDPTTANFD